jgi:hypothetical protein
VLRITRLQQQQQWQQQYCEGRQQHASSRHA